MGGGLAGVALAPARDGQVSPAPVARSAWFRPELQRVEAETLLASSRVGAFLVRGGSGGGLVVSTLQPEGVESVTASVVLRHYIVQADAYGRVSLAEDAGTFEDIDALVSAYSKRALPPLLAPLLL